MRTSGRVVVSAAVVMIAVFLTFALSGPPRAHPRPVLAITRPAAWYQPGWLARILPQVRFAHEVVKAEKRPVHSNQVHYPERT